MTEAAGVEDSLFVTGKKVLKEKVVTEMCRELVNGNRFKREVGRR